MRITVMDQNKELAEAVCATLRAEGYHSFLAATPMMVMEQLGEAGCDLLVLDAAASGGAAEKLIHAVRQTSQAIPILLLAARVLEDAVIALLDAGANDYLVKPVRHGELATRIKILLRRAYPEQHAGELLHFDVYAFDTASGCIAWNGEKIDVTQKEFDLALLFFRHLGRPLSRAYIRETIWPGESELLSRTLDTHVSRVRNKLGLRPENGYRLSPVYSFGYQLEQVSR